LPYIKPIWNFFRQEIENNEDSLTDMPKLSVFLDPIRGERSMMVIRVSNSVDTISCTNKLERVVKYKGTASAYTFTVQQQRLSLDLPCVPIFLMASPKGIGDEKPHKELTKLCLSSGL
jgi:hypothetical protein